MVHGKGKKHIVLRRHLLIAGEKGSKLLCILVVHYGSRKGYRKSAGKRYRQNLYGNGLNKYPDLTEII